MSLAWNDKVLTDKSAKMRGSHLLRVFSFVNYLRLTVQNENLYLGRIRNGKSNERNVVAHIAVFKIRAKINTVNSEL